MEPDKKVCIITGATSGIGKQTAKQLTQKGIHVILACKDEKKCAHTTEDILLEYRKFLSNRKEGEEIPPCSIECMKLDLASFRSVDDFVNKFKEKNLPLDILINNAEVYEVPLEFTIDKQEIQFQVNYLSHWKLTMMLLDKLMQSKDARILNISCDVHQKGKVDLENLDGSKGFNSSALYRQSKLFQVMFTYELHKRLVQNNVKNVSVNCIDPGTVVSKRRPLTLANSQLYFMSKKDIFKASEAAGSIVDLAISPLVKGISGKYWKRFSEARSSTESYDEKVSTNLWNITKKICKLATPF
jgi:retinol dehydrogenase-13